MRIKNLSKIYKGRYDTVKALDDMTLNFDNKGLVFIVGVSGSGKSTLMNMLSGIDKPSNGDVLIGGKSLYDEASGELFGYRNSYVGLIFQDYNLIEDLNVYENIKLPLELLGKTDFSIVDKVMKDIEIEDIKDHLVSEISSGQMQRVAIARALVKDSNVLLADEPTGNLDSTNGDLVLSILKEVSKTKLVIVITHDDAAAQKFGDRIIQIEDGKILADSGEFSVSDDEVELKTVEPIVTFAKQLEFTKKFMRRFFARSLTIFLLLFFVPIVGAILAGYAFFDVGVSYQDHQNKYNEEYVILAMEKRGYNVYFDPEQYTDVFNKYPRSRLIQAFNTYIPLGDEEYDFGSTGLLYANSIDHVLLYQDGFFEIDGSEPLEDNEIVITDYVEACIENQLGYVPETIKIFGYTYTITGVANTNYEKFLKADMSDEFTYNAFMDNLYVYNSIIINESSYSDDTNPNSFVMRTKYFKEVIDFLSKDKVTEVKDLEVTFFRSSAKNVTSQLYSTSVSGYPKLGRNTVYISSALAKAFGFSSNYNRVVGSKTPGITMHGRSRVLASFTVGGVYQSSEYEIIIDDATFSSSDAYKYLFDKVGEGRLVISKQDQNYNKIVNEENVINASFTYASNLNDKISAGRITMFEILFTIVVILIAFGSFMNSYTLAQEKKKIGIKYSLGLSRAKIVTPYILEYTFDILIGIVFSIITAKLLFPLVMNLFISKTITEVRNFSFFYISWSTILGWNLVVAALMMTSLFIMIRQIMRKSPVEIIKDI